MSALPAGFAEGVDGPLEVSRWCPTCAERVLFHDGTLHCLWCDTPTTPADRCAPREKRMGLPIAIREPVLDEARRLYESGLSFRLVAAVIWPQSTYKTERSCAESLYSIFRSRGWPRRSQREVTIARNFKHGRKTRAVDATPDGYAYRRWLKEQRGEYRPLCAAVKANPPQAGRRCSKPAMADSAFCYAHDPERAEERTAHVDQMRALSPIKHLRESRARAPEAMPTRKGTGS